MTTTTDYSGTRISVHEARWTATIEYGGGDRTDLWVDIPLPGVNDFDFALNSLREHFPGAEIQD